MGHDSSRVEVLYIWCKPDPDDLHQGSTRQSHAAVDHEFLGSGQVVLAVALVAEGNHLIVVFIEASLVRESFLHGGFGVNEGLPRY